LKLRAQSITAPVRLRTDTLRRTAEALDVHLDGKVQYHSSMLLSDGTLSPLGATDMEAPHAEVHVALVADATTVTLESPPGGGECGSVGDLLTLTDCSLFVESDGTLTNIGQ